VFPVSGLLAASAMQVLFWQKQSVKAQLHPRCFMLEVIFDRYDTYNHQPGFSDGKHSHLMR
jgi:hypothetical protein